VAVFLVDIGPDREHTARTMQFTTSTFGAFYFFTSHKGVGAAVV
jgi:hypothetical protein